MKSFLRRSLTIIAILIAFCVAVYGLLFPDSSSQSLPETTYITLNDHHP
jgi:hypothetical protein